MDSNKSSQITQDSPYYTIHNVKDDLPKIPKVKQKEKDPYINIPNQVIQNNFVTKYPYDKETNGIRPSPGTPNYPLQQQQQPKDPLRPLRRKILKKNLDGSSIPIPWFVRPFVNVSMERAIEKPARVYKLSLRTPEGRTRDVYIILLLYQTLIGAIGGIAVGIETGYLTPPNPLTSTLAGGGGGVGTELGKRATQSAFMTGITMAWRSVKRATAAGLLFNFVHKNFEEVRGKSDWKNSAYTGALAGAIFGLRGGAQGALIGCTLFSAFAAGSGFLEDFKTKYRAK